MAQFDEHHSRSRVRSNRSTPRGPPCVGHPVPTISQSLLELPYTSEFRDSNRPDRLYGRYRMIFTSPTTDLREAWLHVRRFSGYY